MASSGDWQEVTDSSGKKYYWNKKTNLTSWTVPDGFRPGGVPPPQQQPVQQQMPPVQQQQMPPVQQQPVQQQQQQQQMGRQPAPSSGGGYSAPQSDWREAKDQAGKTYYWNKVTGKTSWTRPAEMGLPAGGAGPGKGTKHPRSGPGASGPDPKRHAGGTSRDDAAAQLDALVQRHRDVARMLPDLYVDGPIPPLVEAQHELSIRRADLNDGRMSPENVAFRLSQLSQRLDSLQHSHRGAGGAPPDRPPVHQGPPGGQSAAPKAPPGVHPSRMGLVTGPSANGPPPLAAPQAAGRRNFRGGGRR